VSESDTFAPSLHQSGTALRKMKVQMILLSLALPQYPPFLLFLLSCRVSFPCLRGKGGGGVPRRAPGGGAASAAQAWETVSPYPLTRARFFIFQVLISRPPKNRPQGHEGGRRAQPRDSSCARLRPRWHPWWPHPPRCHAPLQRSPPLGLNVARLVTLSLFRSGKHGLICFTLDVPVLVDSPHLFLV
jgi:hypothetical protein